MTTIALVMDDWPQITNSIRRELKNEFEVVTANTCADAIRAAKHRMPDVAVIDVLMPESDGIALLDELRGLGFTGPAVVISTSQDPELVRRCGERTNTRYVPKPWPHDAILGALRELMEISNK